VPPQPHDPDLSLPENLQRWHKVELAKHRLFYTLLQVAPAARDQAEDQGGLAFDFVAPSADPPTMLATTPAP